MGNVDPTLQAAELLRLHREQFPRETFASAVDKVKRKIPHADWDHIVEKGDPFGFDHSTPNSESLG